MRVTNELMVTNSVRRLSSRLAEYEHAQRKLATGRTIHRPSDDPSGANRALSLRATSKMREQEARNAQDGLSWLNSIDSQLQGAMERVQRGRELTVQGLNPLGAEPRHAIADEIRTIRDELLSIANADLRGRPLFSGYQDGPAVVEAGGEWYFRTDAQPLPDPPEAITRRVGDDDLVRVNLTAAEVFFQAQGDSVFSALRDIEEGLRADDRDAVSGGLAALDGFKDQLGGSLATVGAHTNWLESALERSQESLFITRDELARIEDADYAEAVMDLQVQDMALQATLQALAQALPPSLASFLR